MPSACPPHCAHCGSLEWEAEAVKGVSLTPLRMPRPTRSIKSKRGGEGDPAAVPVVWGREKAERSVPRFGLALHGVPAAAETAELRAERAGGGSAALAQTPPQRTSGELVPSGFQTIHHCCIPRTVRCARLTMSAPLSLPTSPSPLTTTALAPPSLAHAVRGFHMSAPAHHLPCHTNRSSSPGLPPLLHSPPPAYPLTRSLLPALSAPLPLPLQPVDGAARRREWQGRVGELRLVQCLPTGDGESAPSPPSLLAHPPDLLSPPAPSPSHPPPLPVPLQSTSPPVCCPCGV